MKTTELPTWEEAQSRSHENPLNAFVADLTDIDEVKEIQFRFKLLDAITYVENQQADKILSRLSVIFTDYKNAGFENSAQVTKFIMTEIEEIVKV